MSERDLDSSIPEDMLFGSGLFPETSTIENRDLLECGPLQDEVSGHDMAKISFMCIYLQSNQVSVCSTTHDGSKIQISPGRKVEYEVCTRSCENYGSSSLPLEVIQNKSGVKHKEALNMDGRQIKQRKFDVASEYTKRQERQLMIKGSHSTYEAQMFSLKTRKCEHCGKTVECSLKEEHNETKVTSDFSQEACLTGEITANCESGQARETIQGLQGDSHNTNTSLHLAPEMENEVESQSFNSYYTCQCELQLGDQLLTSNDFETCTDISSLSAEVTVKEEVTPGDMKESNDALNIPSQPNEDSSFAHDNGHCYHNSLISQDDEDNHLEGERNDSYTHVSSLNSRKMFVPYNHVSAKLTDAATIMDGTILDVASRDGDDLEINLVDASADNVDVLSDVAADFDASDKVRTHVMTKDNIGTDDVVRTLIKGGTDEEARNMYLNSKDKDSMEMMNISYLLNKTDERLEDFLLESRANLNNGLHSDQSTRSDVLAENTQVKELNADYELSMVNEDYVQLFNKHEKQINGTSFNLQGQHISTDPNSLVNLRAYHPNIPGVSLIYSQHDDIRNIRIQDSHSHQSINETSESLDADSSYCYQENNIEGEISVPVQEAVYRSQCYESLHRDQERPSVFNRQTSCPSTESETSIVSFEEGIHRDFEYALELQRQLNHEIFMADEALAIHLDNSQHQTLSPLQYGSRRTRLFGPRAEEMINLNPQRRQRRPQHSYRYPGRHRRESAANRDGQRNRGQSPEDISLHENNRGYTHHSHRNSQGNLQGLMQQRGAVAGAYVADSRIPEFQGVTESSERVTIRDRPMPHWFKLDSLESVERIPGQLPQIDPSIITPLTRNYQEERRRCEEQRRQIEAREWEHQYSTMQNWRTGHGLLPNEDYPSLDIHHMYYDPDEVFQLEDGEQYASITQDPFVLRTFEIPHNLENYDQQLNHEIFMEDEALARHLDWGQRQTSSPLRYGTSRTDLFGPRAEEMINLNPQRRQRRPQHSYRQPRRCERESAANRDGWRNRDQIPENMISFQQNNRGHRHHSQGNPHGNPLGIMQQRVAVANANVTDSRIPFDPEFQTVRESSGRATIWDRPVSHYFKSDQVERIERIPGQSAQIDPSIITPLTQNYQEERKRREEQRRQLEARDWEHQYHYLQQNWRTGRDLLPNEDYPSLDVHHTYYDPDEVFQNEDGEQYVSITQDTFMSRSSLTPRRPTFLIPAHLENHDDSRNPVEMMGERSLQGLDQEHIEMLPVHRFHAGNAGENTQCTICLNTYCDNDEIRTLTCLHMFHMACINDWLMNNAVCPLCRQRICP